jgi:hypothetical protein
MADCSSKAAKFPQLQGFKDSLHTLAHDWDKPGGSERLGQWDRFMAEQFAYFLNRLDSATEQQGTLLDQSIVLYGSSNSVTHDNNNYPLILAGGSKMGFKHGRFLKFSDKIPMANLFVTMLNQAGIESPNFADSTGELNELLTSKFKRPCCPTQTLSSSDFLKQHAP